jgi:hypothetical protein
MPHVTTHYRVIVTAGHHRQPRNTQKWIEPYDASNVEAVPGTAMNPFAPPQLTYTADGSPHTADFVFWSAGDGTNGQTSTGQTLNTTVGTAPLTLVAWYLPEGGGPGGPGSGYIVDAFSDALNDFVDDDFVKVSPDDALSTDANVVGYVPTGSDEELAAVPGVIHTGERFEQWIGGHPSGNVDDLQHGEDGYAIATYHNEHLPIPKIPQYEAGVKILWGIINDAPGAVLGPNGPVPVDPGWRTLLERISAAAGVAAMARGMHGAAEVRRVAANEVTAAAKQFTAHVERQL